MPPTAAMTGNAASRIDESSPTSISRFNSSPTSRKKSAMSASLTHSRIVSVSAAEVPADNDSGRAQNCCTPSAPSSVASASAMKVVPMRTTPPAVVRRRNRSKGERIRSKSGSRGYVWLVSGMASRIASAVPV